MVERGSTSHSAPELKQETSPLRDPALTEAVPGVTSGMHLAGGHYSDADRLGPQERASVQKRKEELSSLVATLDEKLSRFDKPLSGEIASILSESSKKSTELNEKLESIRAEVDAATRRLAVWYGRRKRLEISDPVNMASEVSVSSEEVRGRKEAFEKATWEYLKEVEALRYNPGDKERVQRVEELIRIRTDRSRELAVSVRAAIDKSVTDADHAIAELTLERDRVEAELESVKSEEDVVKILMGTDDAAKETIKNDLRRRREGALSELEELKRLLPE